MTFDKIENQALKKFSNELIILNQYKPKVFNIVLI